MPTARVWLGEHKDPEKANPLALAFWGDRGGIGVPMRHFRHRRTPEEMTRLIDLLRQLPGTRDALDDAVAKDYRSLCTFPADQVLASDADLHAFQNVLDQAAAARRDPAER